ncbi:hypothetical protein [Planobispora rosea]|uniref:hypothetical protein n=1 Tax=Planobispora rosea TaxID=35762 RepID=UPI000839E15C|nr:hypothetical protein [Planobispora rosea]
MATPNYPRDLSDEIRDLRLSRTAAQTAGQSRAPYVQASQGLVLPNLAGHPAAPASGVILYALAGHLWCKEADGSQHQLTS